MFSNKFLYIPDYVVYEDIPTIINYFDYYNIAKVKNVETHKHNETEYLTEDNSNINYGFAIIEIDYYYNNQGARNFYSSIENSKGLMVYDDPNSWEVQFSPFNTNTNTINSQVIKEEEDDECVFEEEDETPLDDFNYDIYKQNFNSFKKKQYSKKQKFNAHLIEIKKLLSTISNDQDKIRKLLIINNNLKHKKQNKKQNINQNRDVKTPWSRRLRVKF